MLFLHNPIVAKERFLGTVATSYEIFPFTLMEKLTENHKHSTLLALCEMFKRNVCLWNYYLWILMWYSKDVETKQSVLINEMNTNITFSKYISYIYKGFQRNIIIENTKISTCRKISEIQIVERPLFTTFWILYLRFLYKSSIWIYRSGLRAFLTEPLVTQPLYVNNL